MSDVRTALLAAADLVERGWVQRRMHNADNTAFCLEGALLRTCGDAAGWAAAERLVAHAIGGKNGSLTYWNDNPARTQAEVVSALRRAADLTLPPSA